MVESGCRSFFFFRSNFFFSRPFRDKNEKKVTTCTFFSRPLFFLSFSLSLSFFTCLLSLPHFLSFYLSIFLRFFIPVV